MNAKAKRIITGIVVAVLGAIGGGVGSQVVKNSDNEPQKTAVVTEYVTEAETEAPVTAVTAAPVTKSAKKTERTTGALVTEKPTEAPTDAPDDNDYVVYTFRNDKLLQQHFEKHGADFDYATAEEYERGASDVINSDEALHKTEAEDGDFVYYIEATNEFVVLSTDGYIRTYFKPSGKKAYYDRQ